MLEESMSQRWRKRWCGGYEGGGSLDTVSLIGIRQAAGSTPRAGYTPKHGGYGLPIQEREVRDRSRGGWPNGWTVHVQRVVVEGKG